MEMEKRKKRGVGSKAEDGKHLIGSQSGEDKTSAGPVSVDFEGRYNREMEMNTDYRRGKSLGIDDRREIVGILGAGSWGWTLAHLLVRNGHEVVIWTRDENTAKSISESGVNPKRFPDFPLYGNFSATTDIGEVFGRCEVILVAVSTGAFREVMRESAKFVEGNHIIVSTSKGIEVKTGKRMTEIIKEETCCKKVGVLSGPNLAREILEGNPSAAVIASNIREVQERIYNILHSPSFRIYMSYDVVGVELGGALKNIYAIAAGISDALGFKMNTLALLLSRASSEMMKFGTRLGALPQTFFGLSGVGDLFATASSDLSRNKRFGKLIAKGKTPEEAMKEIGEVVEGYLTTKVVVNLAKEMGVNMPIAEAVYKVVHLRYDVGRAISELLEVEMKEEF